MRLSGGMLVEILTTAGFDLACDDHARALSFTRACFLVEEGFDASEVEDCLFLAAEAPSAAFAERFAGVPLQLCLHGGHDDSLPPRWNVVHASGKTPFALANALLGPLRTIGAWEQELRLLATGHGELQALVDASEPVLGLPLAICGSLFDDFVWTRNLSSPDRFFTEISERGHLSADAVDALEALNVFEDGGRSSRVKVMPPGGELSCWHMSRHFYDKGDRVLYVTAWCPEGAPTELQVGLFDELARFAHRVFNAKREAGLGAMGAQEVGLRELLWKKELTHEHAAEVLKKLGRDPETPHQLAVIQLPNPDGKAKTFQANTLRERFASTVTCVFEEAIVVMLEVVPQREDEAARILDALGRHAARQGGVLGLSVVFNEAAEIGVAYQQALFALEAGTKISREQILKRTFGISKPYPLVTFRFEDYLFHELLGLRPLGLKGINPGRKPVRDLAEYDRAHGTEKLRFLYTYLACNGSTSATARELGMHRNSVGYQVRSIERLLGVDMGDIDFVCHSKIAFASIEMFGI